MNMADTLIDIVNLGKCYDLSHERRPDTLKGLLRQLAAKAIKQPAQPLTEEFWALKNVSLKLNKGECLALIGHNGSGKSTLLKILSRITPPTMGHIRVRGRIASLLEIGTGFHPELTGRENVFLNGAMLGCSTSQIHERFDAIVDFSGVERFLDTPVKHYSSGMYVRLAYAIAAHVEADILAIDEVLAVGDTDFQAKCFAHLETTLDSGTSVIFVSHNNEHVQRLATHIAWMNKGHLLEYGDAKSGILEHREAGSNMFSSQHSESTAS